MIASNSSQFVSLQLQREKLLDVAWHTQLLDQRHDVHIPARLGESCAHRRATQRLQGRGVTHKLAQLVEELLHGGRAAGQDAPDFTPQVPPRIDEEGSGAELTLPGEPAEGGVLDGTSATLHSREESAGWNVCNITQQRGECWMERLQHSTAGTVKLGNEYIQDNIHTKKFDTGIQFLN